MARETGPDEITVRLTTGEIEALLVGGLGPEAADDEWKPLLAAEKKLRMALERAETTDGS